MAAPVFAGIPKRVSWLLALMLSMLSIPATPGRAADPDKRGQGKLSWELHRVAAAYEAGMPVRAQGRRFIDEASDQVTAVIVVADGASPEDVAGAVAAAGGTIRAVARSFGWVKVSLPRASLRSVADHPAVARMRTPYYPGRKAVVSEGVAAIRADDFIARTGSDGAGVTVAVVDVGFRGVQKLIGSELPSGTEMTEATSRRLSSFESSHGTACAEIVHDVAPGAHLILAGFEDGVTWGEALDELILRRVQVITHSIGFDNLYPTDGSSPFSRAADTVAGLGILFVTAAGNEAGNYYQGPAVDADGNGFVEFDGRTELLPIGVLAEDPRVVLRWDDPYGASANDYDLFIVTADFAANPVVEDNPAVLASSRNVQAGAEDPLEIALPDLEQDRQLFAVVGRDGAAAGGEGPRLSLFAAGGVEASFATPAGTLTLPADARGAVAVAAVAAGSLRVEGFSSRGPTSDGRVKPDLAGPDNVSVASREGRRFVGTSAATPHVAGAAALLASGDPTLSGPTLRRALEQSTAGAGSHAAKNNDVGFGLVDLGRAPSPGSPGPDRGRVVLGETSFQDLPPFDSEQRRVGIVRFTMSVDWPVDLQVSVDWSSPANNIDAFLYSGSCEMPNLPSDACPLLGQSTTRLKPEVLTLAGARSGQYSLVVINFGSEPESGTVVISVTP